MMPAKLIVIGKGRTQVTKKTKYVTVHFSYSSFLVRKKTKNDSGATRFYRAMHFSAKRGIAIACRLPVCPSSETLVDCDHIGWNTSEIISPLVSLGCSLSANPNIMGLLEGEHPKILA